MNLTQAEAIASLYAELMESIDQSKLNLPTGHQWSKRVWTPNDISEIFLTDGMYVTVKWSRYMGCGDYETDETTQRLDTLFD